MLKFVKKMLGVDWLDYRINDLARLQVKNEDKINQINTDLAKLYTELKSELKEHKDYVDDRLSYETEELACEMNDSMTKTSSDLKDIIRDMEADVKIIKDKLGIINTDIVSTCNDMYAKYSAYDIALQVEKWVDFLSKIKNSREQKAYLKEIKKKNGVLAGQIKNKLDNEWR